MDTHQQATAPLPPMHREEWVCHRITVPSSKPKAIKDGHQLPLPIEYDVTEEHSILSLRVLQQN